MTASTDQPVSLEQRRWSKELWKIAAAIVAFAVVGGLLVLLLRDNGTKEPQVVGPAPTSTPAASATSTVDAARQTVEAVQAKLTATAQHAPTATPTELPIVADWSALGEVVATITTGAAPRQPAATDDAIWVPNDFDGTISRIDPATNQVVATIAIGTPDESGSGLLSPMFVVVLGGQVWVSDDHSSSTPPAARLVRIDPATNEIVQTIELPSFGSANPSIRGMAAGDGSLWISDFDNNVIARIDPDNGTVLATIEEERPTDIAFTDDSAWVSTTKPNPDGVVRIDLATNQIVARIPTDDVPLHLAVGDGSVWATQFQSGSVVRIDPSTNSVVATIETELPHASALIFTDSGVWIGNLHVVNFSVTMSEGPHGVAQIDPATNTVVAQTLTPGMIGGLIEHGSDIWVTTFSTEDGAALVAHDNAIVRIHPAE